MDFVKTFVAGLLAFIAGSILMFFLSIFILMGIAGSMEKTVAVPTESILRIDFSELLTDAPSTDPFAGFDFATLRTTRQLSLMRALRAIEAAKDDYRIKGIYLRMNGDGGVMGAALLEELREAIVDFKQSGKFVVAYNETYSQGQYYLATAADQIYMQPEGGMDWSGLSFNLMFYKGLLDKLDLKAEVFRPTACKYKSAVEPYILNKMSDSNREQMQQLVNSMWNTIAGEVAEARGIELQKLNQITDKLQVSLPEEALELGFVDGLIYEDQMDDIFAELGVETNYSDSYNFITLGHYAAQVTVDISNLSAGQVAIVYADGAIVDGEGWGRDIYGNTLAAQLAEVRKDEKVKAVVLRVNSPGGSALASDVIWREMELLKAEKPVVVSMGSYAASGGYYIACPADVIVADKLTLTGSIGVFGMYLDTIDALKNKLGITLDGVKSNTSAGMGAISPLTPLERAMVMRGVDKVYTTFTNHVAEGRNLPLEKVLAVAEGRVWSGEDALGIGLIDTYGGLKTAIAIAADKAELEDYRVVEKVDQITGFAALFSSLNTSIREAMTRSDLGLMMKEYKQVQEATSQQGIVMYYPYKLDLR
ncbi:signal peptide peptidase SppA [uncultured Alistipes sp.]|jgi:signal peptide peptidase sppA, 67K type|uniref:signal peptide peptidase SppA n=1 Tax=uncultured Alistipes sp. TaxID=538949 RepID=UPI0025DC8246|nr:signal peptide peptidase SppA [uncultured Alistipes sp.]